MAFIDHHDEHYHGENDENEEQGITIGNGPCLSVTVNRYQVLRKSCHDTGEDYQRYAVSYAVGSDLFTNPHQEHCACCEGDGDDQGGDYPRVDHRGV